MIPQTSPGTPYMQAVAIEMMPKTRIALLFGKGLSPLKCCCGWLICFESRMSSMMYRLVVVRREAGNHRKHQNKPERVENDYRYRKAEANNGADVSCTRRFVRLLVRLRIGKIEHPVLFVQYDPYNSGNESRKADHDRYDTEYECSSGVGELPAVKLWLLRCFLCCKIFHK